MFNFINFFTLKNINLEYEIQLNLILKTGQNGSETWSHLTNNPIPFFIMDTGAKLANSKQILKDTNKKWKLHRELLHTRSYFKNKMLILSSCLYSKQRCSVPLFFLFSSFPLLSFHPPLVCCFSVQLWMATSFLFPSLCFLAFSFLLPLLKLPESSSPSVPPLNDQTALVCHHSALSRGILVISQK